MAAPRPMKGPGSGIAQILAGFGIVLGIGFALLMLPVASESGGWGHPRTALFTAISAICVTGLVIHDTQTHWSTFGEVVILTLVQLGGLGYMLGTTVVLWAFGRQLDLRDRLMLRLYYGAPTMRETLGFARGVGLFTLAFEATGAVVLSAAFMADGRPAGEALWWGAFHSISAFNNAGFNLTGADMVPYSGNEVVLSMVSILVIAGGFGYLPVLMLVRRRSFRRLPLDSKLIFATSGVLLVVGTLAFAAFEWRNEATLGGLAVQDRPLAAFFHSTSSRSSGYALYDIGALYDESKVSTIGLMFVGGAAGSTAGGLKVGAFSMLFAVMLASLRGRDEVTAFRRLVPPAIIRQATTLALFYVGLLFAFTLALTLASDQDFVDVVFEAMSALGTVGFTAAGTLSFGGPGHVILMIAMLFGRFSPLMLVLYMSKPRRAVQWSHPVDSVRLG